jgi:hypothetical protein
MSRSLFLRSLIGIVLLTALFFLLSGVNLAYRTYSSIFRLSINQISNSLPVLASHCKIINDCKLLPGDILIRRYITQRTWLVDKLAHPYFTHSAFYLGDDQIVEAVGTEKNPEDEIQTAILSKSDWSDIDVKNFVVIRPQYTGTELKIIKDNLKKIAGDPDYKFGLPGSGYKRATCADLIFNQLLNERVISISNSPEIITPDYLFSLATKNPDKLEIVGFSIIK